MRAWPPGGDGSVAHPLRRWPLLLIGGLTLTVAVGCSGASKKADTYGERSATTVAGNAVTVELTNLQFVPQGIRIKPGTTVTWVNKDAALHNVSSIDGLFLSAPQGDMKEGDTYKFTFDKPGTYRYQCTFHHPNMNGVVIVEE